MSHASQGVAMLFAKLRALREFERRHLKQLSTVEDLDLVCEIGFHQEKGQPLSIKQLYLLNLASVATIQRRLRRLLLSQTLRQQAETMAVAQVLPSGGDLQGGLTDSSYDTTPI